MQLSGNQIFKASASRVWEMLTNPDMFSKVVPGITKLEKLSENSYKSILNLKIGPVTGSFSGNLQLEDIVDQKSFRLKTQQNSKIGNANADLKIKLDPVDKTQTEVAFDGDAKISGLLATMGQRVLGAVANTLTKQFFANLEKELLTKESPDKLMT
jgi:carbon monoxide dehydrogenase subunit G